MIRILFILYLIFLIEIQATRRRCINSGTLFLDKTLRSPIVVYGEPIAKRIYRDSTTDLLYNVTFRVDCVLKGRDVENRIEITEAGIKSGHLSCQYLDPGHRYIVFLEKWGINTNDYRPLDFQEVLVDNSTYQVLAKTCHLSRIQPLNSNTNNCPNVSMPKYCPYDTIDMNTMPKPKFPEHINPDIQSSYFNNGNQFYLQSNVTIPKLRSVETSFDVKTSNSAYSLYLFKNSTNSFLFICISTINLLFFFKS